MGPDAVAESLLLFFCPHLWKGLHRMMGEEGGR